MIAWRRVGRFNTVGALGILVQVVVIWTLTDVASVPYLPATVAGVSAAVLHNFFWHLCWTWSDRALTPAESARALVRFTAANGVVSLAGNAVVMAVLVGTAGLHPVPAAVLAIAACGIANYWLADRVVFRGGPSPVPRPGSYGPTSVVRT